MKDIEVNDAEKQDLIFSFSGNDKFQTPSINKKF